MSQPKKRISNRRRNNRRFSHANELASVTLTQCPTCNEPTRPHRVCRCGAYAGRQVLKKPAAKKETTAATSEA